MTTRVITYDDVSQECGQAELVPYPDVAVVDNITSTPTTDANGKTTYTLNVPDQVTSFTLNGASNNAILTTTGGNYAANLNQYDQRLVQNAAGDVALYDASNATYGAVPVWDFAGTAATLANDMYGLGRVVDKPLSAATTLADIALVASYRAAPSYHSMRALFTNRAAEDGAAGMMNASGHIGHYTEFTTGRPMTAGSTFTPNEINGGATRMDLANGEIASLADGIYNGQIMHIQAPFSTEVNPPAGAEFGEVILRQANGNPFGGSYRHTDKAIREGSGSTPTNGRDMVLRSNESVSLVWSGDAWRILSINPYLAHGASFLENRDGTADMWFGAIITNADEIVELPLPMPVVNPTDLRVFIQDYSTANPAVGAAIPTANDAAVSFLTYPNGFTATTIKVAARNHAGGTLGGGTVNVFIKGAKLDYAALGGVAAP